MATDTQILQMALDAGASKAVILTTDQVKTSDTFRDICASNGCGYYGRCWMCPPDIGEIHAVMASIANYRYGLWYQTIQEIEDSYDIEGMTEGSMRHAQVSQRLARSASPLLMGETLHLTCGGCRLCEECAKRTGEPCRRPNEALPSLEGYGVDVYQTTKDTPLKYINGQNTVTYFGMLLYGEKTHA